MGTAPLAIPGFVDLQVNGYKGTGFSSADVSFEDLAGACRMLLASGTAAFLPTIVTAPPAVYERNLPMIARLMQQEEFSGRLLGVHIEGPFISREPGAVGAHTPKYVSDPDIALLDRMVEWSQGCVRLLTVAAEAAGVDELIEHAVQQGIAVSVGHTLADSSDLRGAVDAGATALTHFGNGVPNTIPRHNNPLWAGLAEEHLTAMIITDGHHLPAHVIRAVLQAKGMERTVVVSDASPLAGMPPGRYETLGNVAVLEEDGLLHNPEKQCLVGSSATMLQCMNHLASLGVLTLEDMLAVGFYNPLSLIGASSQDVAAESELYYNTTTRMFVVQGG
jgi:N-acetylglucosamine-6-phosphate deacetylase